MIKLLFFVLIGGIVYWRLRHPRPAAGAAAVARPVEDMVRCAHCGLHLPRGEALGSGAIWFCGGAHQSAHRH